MAHQFWSSEEYDERAHSLYSAGDLDGALETLKEGLALYPNAVELYVGLGYARLAREEFAWARQSFESALALDGTHEDALAGLGEVLLRFGQREQALALFQTVEEMVFEDDVELMLTMGRALYREGLFPQALDRFLRLAAVRPDVPDALAAAGYCLHRLGEGVKGARYLRRALKQNPALNEARVYLGHILYDRGDWEPALRELEQVPPLEHWDPLAVWRLVELKRSIYRISQDDPRLGPWLDRLRQLEAEDDDPVERLLTEVEARFGGGGIWPLRNEDQLELFQGREADATSPVRIRVEGGRVYRGSWPGLVRQIRDAAGFSHEPLTDFMRRTAERWREEHGLDVPFSDPRSFLRSAVDAGIYELLDDVGPEPPSPDVGE